MKLWMSLIGSGGILLFCVAGVSAREEGLPRVWTSSDGRTLTATYVTSSSEVVLLRLENGREARVMLDQLSDADLDWLKQRNNEPLRPKPSVLPDETSMAEKVRVEGGPRIFRTAHFEFETDREVSNAFIAEAAQVYEGAFAAMRAISHGLNLSPPEGKERYRGRFMDDRAFSRLAAEKMEILPGQKVAGLYLSDERELVVPYSSLGAEVLGSRLTLRKRSDTTTLIHEIVHQLMHEWLPVTPTWFSEGFAEYLAAVPYQNGRFEFRNAERGLNERLKEQYLVEKGKVQGVRRPSEILGSRGSGNLTQLGRDREDSVLAGVVPDRWEGTVDEYRDALLLVYYLMHLRQPDSPGTAVGRYLYQVDAGLKESAVLEKEVEGFEQRRVAYNLEVKRFNDALAQFREKVEIYNNQVRQYNDELVRGVSEDTRIKVGPAPEAPVPPEPLEMPEAIEREIGPQGIIDLVQIVQRKSLPYLVSYHGLDLDRDMQQKFSDIGIEIGYRFSAMRR